MKSESIDVSTPGKLMLMGEHAVIYGRPCIVTAVNQRMQVKIEKAPGKEILVEAPEVGVVDFRFKPKTIRVENVSKGAKFIVAAASNFDEKWPINSGLKIATKSEFSSEFGFGSSSAVTVGVLRALAEVFEVEMDNWELFNLAYKSVLDVQGVGSGFDLAAAIWGGTLYFVTGGKEITPLKVGGLPLVVGYTGIKADTATWVRFVSQQYDKYPKLVDGLFDKISELVELARKGLENKHWKEVGELMDINQGILEALGVSTLELSRLIYTARGAGAWGAKLSGAGGGDCMIALVSDGKKTKIENQIKENGGKVIRIMTGARGVTVER